jgi:hypothetical protein
MFQAFVADLLSDDRLVYYSANNSNTEEYQMSKPKISIATS